MKYFSTLTVTLILLSFSNNSYSQMEISWQQCYGTSLNDYFGDAINTSDYGVVACLNYSTNDGDAEGLFEVESPACLVKFDSIFQQQWIVGFGGSIYESEFMKVVQLNNGDIVAAGESMVSDGDFSESRGWKDLVLVKIDQYGNKIWSHCYGTPGFDYFSSMLSTLDGGFLLSGWSFSTGGEIPINYGEIDVIVIKVDSNGLVVWSRNLGGSLTDTPCGNMLETDRGYYTLNIQTSSNDFDMAGVGIDGPKHWMLRLDSLGFTSYEKIYSDSTNFFMNWDIEMKFFNDKIYITGDADPLSNVFPDISGYGGETDGAIAVFNTNFELIDLELYGGTQNDIINRILPIGNGEIIVLGTSYSSDGDLPGNYGYEDYWLMKLRDDLSVVSSMNFGGVGALGHGDLGFDKQFAGNIILLNQNLYTFIRCQVPENLPDHDITCGIFSDFVLAPMDAWIVEFDTTILSSIVEPQYKRVSLYPNPTLEEITMEFSEHTPKKITLFDETGQTIKIFESFEQHFSIQLLNYASGIYFIKIEDGMNSSIQKFIKQ